MLSLVPAPFAHHLFGMGALSILGAGLALALTCSPTDVVGLDSGTCRDFNGASLGNDPTQRVKVKLCREGDHVWGVKSSTGEAGHSQFMLKGQVGAEGTLHLEVSSVLVDEPADGWVSCSDDIFELKYDRTVDALVGRYVSEECEDTANMMLSRGAERELNCH